jgi:hypothetical protein
MPLDPTHLLVGSKHACYQYHAARESTFLPVDTVKYVATLKAQLDPKGLSQLVWAHVVLRLPFAPTHFTACLVRMAELAPLMVAQDVSMCMWAIGKLTTTYSAAGQLRILDGAADHELCHTLLNGLKASWPPPPTRSNRRANSNRS